MKWSFTGDKKLFLCTLGLTNLDWLDDFYSFNKKSMVDPATKKTFIIPLNDAESFAIKELLEKKWQHVLLSQQWRWASREGLETEIKQYILESLWEDIIGIDLWWEIPSNHCKNLSNTELAIGQKGRAKLSVIEKIWEMLWEELSIQNKFIAANNIGYIPEMVKLWKKLKLTEEEINEYIKKVNELENKAQGITEEIVEMANKAVEDWYIYDDRLIWIDLKEFKGMRPVTNLLYEINKNKNLWHETTVINTQDEGKRVIVFSSNHELISLLSELYPNNSWKWGGDGAQFRGIQFKTHETKSSFEKELRYFLEEEILWYHRIIEKEDIKNTYNYWINLNIHQINNPIAFHKSISIAKKGNDHWAFVHTYKPLEYKNMDLFIVNAGAAWIAIKSDWDVVSVFKNPDMAKKDMIDKINHVLLLTVLQQGGKKLDCFDGFLPSLYRKYWFYPVAKQKFNTEFAPEEWNYERDGTPDIIFMAYNWLPYDINFDIYLENRYLPLEAYQAPYTDERDKAQELQKKAISDVEIEKNILTEAQKCLIKKTSLFIPVNDGESVLIRELALRLWFDVKEVKQERWANLLEKEIEETPDLLNNIKEDLWIVEMPSEKLEAELSKKHNVNIIDHHFYGYENRSKGESSIEQFINKVWLTEHQLKMMWYNLRFIKWVGINDKEYIYGLYNAWYSNEEIMVIREFDIRCQLGKKYKTVKMRNKEIYNTKREENGIIILSSQNWENTSLASDRVVLEKNPNYEIKKILNVKKDDQNKITFISLSWEKSWISEIKENLYPDFWGNGIGKYGDFVGWDKPNEKVIVAISQYLRIEI